MIVSTANKVYKCKKQYCVDQIWKRPATAILKYRQHGMMCLALGAPSLYAIYSWFFLNVS